MDFWASSETYGAAGDAVDEVRRRVQPFLAERLLRSELRDVVGEIRYIPIVMPDNLLEKYKERSGLNKPQSIYVCAPHLSYELFLNGSFDQRKREYLRGLSLSLPYLNGLNLSESQVGVFAQMIRDAAEAT